jgi:universal stress protein E
LVKSADAWETRRIVACVDPAHVYSHAETLDDVIVEAAQLLAYRLRGELHIFHSVELMLEPVFSLLQPESSYALYKRRMGEAHYRLLDDLLRRYGIGTQRVHLTIGRPTETLVEFARDIGASLVVMGAVSKGPLELLLIGNTAEKVLDDLSCDILVVKSEPLEARVAAEPSMA